jgi:hypothetical protein
VPTALATSFDLLPSLQAFSAISVSLASANVSNLATFSRALLTFGIGLKPQPVLQSDLDKAGQS